MSASDEEACLNRATHHFIGFCNRRVAAIAKPNPITLITRKRQIQALNPKRGMERLSFVLLLSFLIKAQLAEAFTLLLLSSYIYCFHSHNAGDKTFSWLYKNVLLH